jgi:hypothetical protein
MNERADEIVCKEEDERLCDFAGEPSRSVFGHSKADHTPEKRVDVEMDFEETLDGTECVVEQGEFGFGSTVCLNCQTNSFCSDTYLGFVICLLVDHRVESLGDLGSAIYIVLALGQIALKGPLCDGE